MSFTTWHYRRSAEQERLLRSARSARILADAVSVPPVAAAEPGLPADSGLAFTSREYTFFVRTGVAGTAADPLVAGIVFASTTARSPAEGYSLDAARSGWQISSAGVLSYVGAALPTDAESFTLDVTATLGMAEAHARINVVVENLSPFRLSNAFRSDNGEGRIHPFPFSFITGDRDVKGSFPYNNTVPPSLNEAIFGKRIRSDSGVVTTARVSADFGRLGWYFPLDDPFVSDSPDDYYRIVAYSSVPGVVDYTICLAGITQRINERGRTTNVGNYIFNRNFGWSNGFLRSLYIASRYTGQTTISVAAVNSRGVIAGGFSFNWEALPAGNNNVADPGADPVMRLGGDVPQRRPVIIGSPPMVIRGEQGGSVRFNFQDYFSFAPYGLRPTAVTYGIGFYDGQTNQVLPSPQGSGGVVRPVLFYRGGWRRNLQAIRADSRRQLETGEDSGPGNTFYVHRGTGSRNTGAYGWSITCTPSGDTTIDFGSATPQESLVLELGAYTSTVGDKPYGTDTLFVNVEVVSGLNFTQDLYAMTLVEGVDGSTTPAFVGGVLAYGDDVTYALTAGDATKFQVVTNTGVDATGAAVNYIGSGESLDEQEVEFDLVVSATSGGETVTARVVVDVAPQTPPPIAFSSDSYEFELPAFAGAQTIGQVVAQSTVPTVSTQVRYEIDDTTNFAVDEDGTVRFLAERGRAAGQVISTTVRALAGRHEEIERTEAALSLSFFSQVRSVPVITFQNTPYSFDLPEGQPSSVTAVLGTVSATVTNTTESVTYSLDTEDVPFAIDEFTGVVSYTGAGENFDVRSQYSLVVAAEVAETLLAQPARATQIATVNITEVTTVARLPDWAADNYTFVIPSGVAGSTNPIVVGSVFAAGADIGYAVFPPDAEPDNTWAVVRNAAGEGVINYVGAARPNGTSVVLVVVAETNSSSTDPASRGEAQVNVTVQFTSGALAAQTITWPVANLTDNRYEFTLPENTAVPSVLATILPAVTAAAGVTTGVLSLSVGGDDAASFSWSATGVLSLITQPDFESKQTYDGLLTVVAAATATAREETSRRWARVSVTDVEAEGAGTPVFAFNNYRFDLESGTSGAVAAIEVGAVSARTSAGVITYAITAGNTNNRFAIDATTGVISYVGTGETTGSFNLTITATATLGASTAASTTAVAVDVRTRTAATADVQFPLDSRSYRLDVGSAGPTLLTPIIAARVLNVPAGATAGQLTYSLTGADAGDYTINRLTGQITYTGSGETDGTTHNFNLVATSESNATLRSGSDSLAVTVNFRAAAAPVFDDATPSFDLPSGTDGRTTSYLLGVLAASDADRYELVNEVAGFRLDSSNGHLFWVGNDPNVNNDWTIQVRAVNSVGSAVANVDITVKGIVTIAFEPTVPDWRIPESTPGPIVLGTMTVNTATNDRFALPSAPSLVPTGDDGEFISAVPTAHNIFEISYTGVGLAAGTSTLSFGLLATSAENGTALGATGRLSVRTPVVPEAPVVAAQTLSVPDGTAAPADVGAIAASNTGAYSQVWRIITAQTGTRRFALDASTGEVSYVGPDAIARATEDSYTLQIGVRNVDGARRSHETIQTITIAVVRTYQAPVRNAGWSPGAGWTASADGSWTRTLTQGSTDVINITAGATGPYTFQSGLTATYRNDTIPSPSTDFSVTRSNGIFTITASATETGTETLELYLSDGTTEERLVFHVAVVAAAATPTEVTWYEDDNASYRVIGADGISITFPEGQAAGVTKNIYAAYTQITNRTNATLDVPSVSGFTIVAQTLQRRQIAIGAQQIWIDAFEIAIDPTKYDFETQSRYDLTPVLNIPAYTAGSTTYAAAHKPLPVRLNIQNVDEPPVRTSRAGPDDFSLRIGGAQESVSLEGLWKDPEGDSLSYRLTQSVVDVGSTGALTTVSRYVTTEIDGDNFIAYSGEDATTLAAPVRLRFQIESFDGTSYSPVPVVFYCTEIHARDLEDSPLEWDAGVPERLIWQIAENTAVPYLLRSDIFATSTVTALNATAGDIGYELETATYWIETNPDFDWADNAPSLAAGETYDIDMTGAFVIRGDADAIAGKDWTLTAEMTDPSIGTFAVSGKTATITAANDLTAQGTSTFLLFGTTDTGFVDSYTGDLTVAAAPISARPVFQSAAGFSGTGTQSDPYNTDTLNPTFLSTDALFTAPSAMEIIQIQSAQSVRSSEQDLYTDGWNFIIRNSQVRVHKLRNNAPLRELIVTAALVADDKETATATIYFGT